MPKPAVRVKVSNVQQGKSGEGSDMKRLLAFIVVLTLLVIGGTIVSADGQTHRRKSAISNTNLDKLFRTYGG